MERYTLIKAPAAVTVLGKDYFYYWDNAPGLPMSARIIRHPQRDHFTADGNSPEEARAALIECGRNPEDTINGGTR